MSGLGLGLGLGLGAQRKVGRKWTPRNISNIYGWYDAHDLSSITFPYPSSPTVAGTWKDQITGTRQFTAAEVTGMTYDASSKSLNCLHTTGQWMQMESHGLGGMANLTVIVIMKRPALTGGNASILDFQDASQTQFYLNDTSQLLYCGSMLGQPISQALFAANYKMLLYNYVDGGTSTIMAYKLKSDGTTITKTGSAGSNDIPSDKMYLGRTRYLSYLTASLKSVIFVAGTMSAEEITALTEWAETYYGIA